MTADSPQSDDLLRSKSADPKPRSAPQLSLRDLAVDLPRSKSAHLKHGSVLQLSLRGLLAE
jgi:hypothetical protein